MNRRQLIILKEALSESGTAVHRASALAMVQAALDKLAPPDLPHENSFVIRFDNGAFNVLQGFEGPLYEARLYPSKEEAETDADNYGGVQGVYSYEAAAELEQQDRSKL